MLLIKIIFLYIFIFITLDPCYNGGVWNNGTCKCLPGFEGFDCKDLNCINGDYVQDSNICLCRSGWLGTSCNICQNSESCEGLLVCDRTLIETSYKTVTCNTDDPKIKDLLGNIFNFVCSKNDTCYLHVWNKYFNQRTEMPEQFERMYCNLINCNVGARWKKDIKNDYIIYYTCEISQCNCTKCDDEVMKRMVEATYGRVEMNCDNSTRICVVDIKNLPIKPIPLNCNSGKCDTYFPNPPIIPPIPEYTPWYMWFALAMGIFGICMFIFLLVFFLYSLIMEFAKPEEVVTKASSIDVKLFYYSVRDRLKTPCEFFRLKNWQCCNFKNDKNDIDLLKPKTLNIKSISNVLMLWNWSQCRIFRYKRVLKDIIFKLENGKSLIIIGETHAGKSSLLRKMAGIHGGHIYGTIDIENQSNMNNIAFAGNDKEMILQSALTGRDILNRSVSLRRKPTAVVDIDLMVKEFGMEKSQYTLTDQMCSGERKRLTIMKELLSGPTILFIDELTSGLDIVWASKIIKFVTDHCKANNITLIASIHQPPKKAGDSSIFDVFDYVMIIKDGYNIHYGEFKRITDTYSNLPGINNEFSQLDKLTFIIQYFSKQPDIETIITNKNIYIRKEEIDKHKLPDDVMKDVDLKADKKTDLEEDKVYNAHMNLINNESQKHPISLDKLNIVNTHNNIRTGYSWQFLQLMKYNLKAVIRTWYVYFFAILVMIAVGLIIGVTTVKLGFDLKASLTRAGIIGVSLLILSLFSINSIRIFNVHKVAYTYEYAAGYYYALPYFLSHVITDWLIWRVIECLSFILCFYFFIGLRLDMIGWFIVIELLFNFSYGAFGLILSSLIKYEYLSNFIFLITVIISLLGSGVIINFDTGTFVIQILKFITPISYAVECLMCNEFNDKDIIAPGIVIDGKKWLAELQMYQSHFTTNLIILMGFPIFLLTLGFLSMKYCLAIKV
jgi:ABC-type multidrug transport system ATPase subunit